VSTGERELVGVIGRAYDAATDRARWRDLLDDLARVFRCELVAFDLRDEKLDWARVQCHVGPSDARLQRDYEAYYASRNVFLRTRPDLTFSGAIRNGEAIVPDRVAMRSEYFNDFLKRIGVLHAIGLVPVRAGSVMGLISLMRKIGAPSFANDDLAFLSRLMPHLQRAVIIQRRLQGVELELAAATEALDRTPSGVAILDEDGRVLLLNAAAEEMLAEADGLRTLDGRLSAAGVPEAAALRGLVARACAPPRELADVCDGYLRVPRPSGRRPYVLLIAPLHVDRLAPVARRPAAIVILSDPERTPAGVQPALRHLYGLTPSEAEVTERLLAGRSLEEIGEELGTSIHTTRTHVKRVLWKTGARSQADLARLLLRSPVGLRPGRPPRAR
jgi:DNA-binding CsgD family transcriptional regulator/PAS domain-containing protein